MLNFQPTTASNHWRASWVEVLPFKGPQSHQERCFQNYKEYKDTVRCCASGLRTLGDLRNSLFHSFKVFGPGSLCPPSQWIWQNSLLMSWPRTTKPPHVPLRTEGLKNSLFGPTPINKKYFNAASVFFFDDFSAISSKYLPKFWVRGRFWLNYTEKLLS